MSWPKKIKHKEWCMVDKDTPCDCGNGDFNKAIGLCSAEVRRRASVDKLGNIKCAHGTLIKHWVGGSFLEIISQHFTEGLE